MNSGGVNVRSWVIQGTSAAQGISLELSGSLFHDWNVKMLLPVSHDVPVALQVPCVQVLPDSRACGREQVF